MTQQVSVESVLCQLQALSDNQTALFQAIQGLNERSQNQNQNDPFLGFRTPDQVKNLPTFSGRPKKEASAFIDDVDKVLELFAPYAGTATYTQIVWAIKAKIIGEAREVLIAAGNPSGWDEIKEVLQNAYGDRRDLASHMQSLFYIKQGNKSLPEYFNKIRSIDTAIKSCAASNPDYKDSTRAINKFISLITLTRYVDGLDDQLSMHVRSHEPENLEHAYSITMQYHNAQFRKQMDKKTERNIKSQFNEPRDRKNYLHKQERSYNDNAPPQRDRMQSNYTAHKPNRPGTSGKYETNKLPDGDVSMRTIRSTHMVNHHGANQHDTRRREFDDSKLESDDDELFSANEINFHIAQKLTHKD